MMKEERRKAGSGDILDSGSVTVNCMDHQPLPTNLNQPRD